MAGKPSVNGWTVDVDQEFLDNTIALLLDAAEYAEWIMNESDDPEIVQAAVNVIKAVRAVQDKHIDYRPRLVELRRAGKAGGEAGKG